MSTKTKKYVKIYARHTAKKSFLMFNVGTYDTCYKNVKISDLQLAY